MGGSASRRWRQHARATTVEECLTVDLGLLARRKALTPGCFGRLDWSGGGRVTASILYAVHAAADGMALALRYRWTPSGGTEAEAVEEVVFLEGVPQRLGGLRWWTRCPRLVDDAPCRRRVSKLHLPPGSKYFGCRACHRLSYTSRQRHDKRGDFLLRQPDALERAPRRRPVRGDGSCRPGPPENVSAASAAAPQVGGYRHRACRAPRRAGPETWAAVAPLRSCPGRSRAEAETP